MKTIKFLACSLVVASGVMMTSCGDDDSNNSLPPIGGYNSADEIGMADLVAYWPLNGTGVESKSGAAPTASPNTTWVPGPKGQAASFANGYMRFGNMASFPATMNAFTISAWVKVKNNKVGDVGTASAIFSMARANEWAGNMNLIVETGARPSVVNGVVNDSLIFKGAWSTTANGLQAYENALKLEPWMIADNEVTPGKHVANANKVADQWAHMVFTWDGSNNKFIIYSNGQKISNPAFEIRGTNTSLTFDTPTFPMIGAFGNVETTADSWNKPMTGQVDEIRVWKKALTSADINALYELERAGR